MEQSSISLNKYISSTGICSRREADKWIDAGRVRINGKKAAKGNRVEPGDSVTIDGKTLRSKKKPVYLLFHKPPGVTCTTDRKDKDNIIDFIKYEKRIFPIGRLDKPSSGLIIMTNDGDMVNRILRKENMHEKEYIVKVDRPMNKNFLNKMSKSIPMLGTRTIPAVVTRLSTQVFSIVLIQGLNRQIRRMVEYCGYKVVSLKRIRIMHLELGDLPSGKWRPITREEMKELDIRLRNDVK